MRTIRNLALCIPHFAFVFAAALSGFAKTFDVDISTGRPAASNEAYYHGETIEFRAVRGRSVVTNIEYASIYYQTNGMGDVWWKTDGLTFHPTNDVGAASYRFFMEGRETVGSGGVESGGVDSPTPSLTHSPTISRDWHANGLLRLLPSPGFTPNEITMPVATLDFAAVEVLNPPYYDKAETEAKIVELAPAPGNYAAVSNAAVYAADTNALQDTELESHASQLSQLSQSLDGKADREIVIGQVKGLPGDCFPIAYVYNGDSYSIANSGGIVVDRSGPGYYRLADSVTGVAVCYFRISDGAYFSNGEASGIIFGGTAPTQLAWPVLGDVAKKSSVVYDVDIKTNYYDKAETEAKISGKQDKLPYPTNAIPYAAISGKPSLATVATSGSYNDLSDKPTIPTVPTNVSAFNNDAGYLTGYTESDPTIKSWAKANTKPTYTASEVGAATAEDVYRIVAGTNVILVVTNYNSAVHAPAMKLQHLDPESGQYVTYWDEQRRHGMTLTNAMDYTDAAAAAELSRANAAYAPRAWSRVTSGLGADAPDGTTFISTPVTHISGGFEFEKKITARGTVWTLCSTSLAAGSTTNGFFEISALDGTPVFSVEKTDSVLVGVNASAIAVVDNACVISVPAVADTHPFARVATTLVNPTWYKETEDGMPAQSPATVSWSGQSGAWVATVDFGASPQGFVFFEYLQEGGVKIVNSAVVDLSQGVHCGGATYMPTVSGNELKFIRQ